MKRLLWLLCIAALCPLSAVGCGDDSGGGNSEEDGGVTPADLDEVNNRVDDIEENLTGLTDDVDNLGDELSGLSDELDALSEDALDRLDALENPPVLSCSETSSCLWDGLDLVKDSVTTLLTRVCQLEVDCCDPGELNWKFGPSITDVDSCVALAEQILDNGQTPYFLEQGGFIVDQAVNLAAALNDTNTRVQLNADGFDECLESLNDRTCNQYTEPGEYIYPTNCSEINDNSTVEDPCYITNLVIGLEGPGESCNPANPHVFGFSECTSGHYCQEVEGSCEDDICDGICVPNPVVGDLCLNDYNCYTNDNTTTNGVGMFCNTLIGECQLLGDVGDDCAYIDPTHSVSNGNLNPWYYQYSATSVKCRPGTHCSPVSHTCVESCEEDALCIVNTYQGNPNGDPTFNCPTGTVCNLTANEDLRNNFSNTYYWGGFLLGYCTAPLANGQPCYGDRFDYMCSSNRCEYDETDGRYECFAALGNAGADCSSGSECKSGACGEDDKCAELCDCQGDGCDENDRTCPANHYCSDEHYACNEDSTDCDSVCQPLIANGSACGTSYEGTDQSCASGNCDDNETGTCMAKLAAGAVCQDDAQCPANHYCGFDESDNNTQCKAYRAAGANCEPNGTDDIRCVEGTTCVTETGNDTCQAFAEVGDPCDDENDGEPECNDNLDCIDVDGEAGSGDVTECYASGDYPNGADCGEDFECASGSCQPDDADAPTTWNCANPIEEGEDCDLDDPTMDDCEPGTHCNYPRNDDDSYAGECTRQGTVGEPCDPRFDNEDCVNYASCQLRNNQFLCSTNALPPESVMCDNVL